MARSNSKSGGTPHLPELSTASRRARSTKAKPSCSSRIMSTAGWCMAAAGARSIGAPATLEISPLAGDQRDSVQRAGRGEFETVSAPAAPASQVPRQQLALAADREALVRALAVGLDGLFADRQVQRNAYR